jgi:hypothetical protein
MTSATNDQYHEIDDAAVSATLEVARQEFEGRDMQRESEVSVADSGELELRAACLSLVSANRKVCLKLPLGIGNVCIPLPFDVRDGTAVQACVGIRTKWGIPTGVCVRILLGGEQLVKKCLP